MTAMKTMCFVLLYFAPFATAEPLPKAPAKAGTTPTASVTLHADYSYWCPEFPKRFDTSEKLKALNALLEQYADLIKRINHLNDEIDAKQSADASLKAKYHERDVTLARIKLLESEARLWRH
jgi:hypothetical protein